LTPGVAAEEAVAGKDAYTFWNPTPVEKMRPLSADRPDGTESPYTVDAGHFQLEVSLFDFTHNDDGDRVDTYTILDTNFKIGLTNQIDLQLIMPLIVHEKSRPQGTSSTSTITDSGDLTVRLKINLWGNDGGETAFGVMPFIKIPTNTSLGNEHVEGGLILSYAWDTAPNWGLGFMLEFDSVYDEDTGDDDLLWVHTAVLGVDLVGDLGAYFEYIGTGTSARGHAYEAVFSTGLTYQVTENIIWDVGAMIGMNEAAEDVRAFVGFTWRY
jgi:hypothetical protein